MLTSLVFESKLNGEAGWLNPACTSRLPALVQYLTTAEFIPTVVGQYRLIPIKLVNDFQRPLTDTRMEEAFSK